jgi:hypothetical protein
VRYDEAKAAALQPLLSALLRAGMAAAG